MKRLLKYSILVYSSMTIISCQNGDFSSLTGEDDSVFTASVNGEIDTKTTLTSGNKVNWESGDEITINGVPYIATPKSDATQAILIKENPGDVSPQAPYQAFYPSTIQNGVGASGILPSCQSYTSGEICNVPMYATSTTTSLLFKNICTLLSIKVKSEVMASLKGIRISSSNCAMSGAFTVNSDDTAVLTSPTSIANDVTLTFESAVNTSISGTVFHIAVPAQTYRNLKIELSSDGLSYTKAMTTKKDIDITTAVNTNYTITFKEDAPATTGTAEATISGKVVNVNWVQLWKEGPKFADRNVGASTTTGGGSTIKFAEAIKTGSAYVWGANWKTPSRDEMDLLNNAKVKHSYCQESGVWGFKFTGVQAGYTANSIFIPAIGGMSNYGNGKYWSSTPSGSAAWYLNLFFPYSGYCNCSWNTFSQNNGEFWIRPVLSN